MEDRTLAGYCGLFCGACTAYIATTEEPERLKGLAGRTGRKIEDYQCKGCRSDTLSYYCKTCPMKECIRKKGLEFCGECEEYPCALLTGFQPEKAHRIELFESLDYAKENGYGRWAEKMREDYSCGACKTINSAYDLSCRSCGNSPSNSFVKRNGAKIREFVRNRPDARKGKR